MSILIIGNGFDLQCNLKSRFKDYFELSEVEDKLTKLENWVIKSAFVIDSKIKEGYFSDITIIDLLMMNDGYDNWFDVENKVKELVYGEKNNWFSRFNDIIGSADKVFHDRVKELLIESAKKVEESKTKLMALHLFSDDFYEYKTKSKIKTKKEANRFLYEQLMKFEFNFTKYLIKTLNENSNYESAARGLINAIQYTPDCGFNGIFSFNYSRPNVLNDYAAINIHGTLESSKIIIGIDGSEKDYDTDSFYFTKSYRIMSNSDECKTNGFKLPDELERITFYGHSLNLQDYAYFQSIFDKYDIYNSEIHLNFCYSIYEKTRAEEITNEYYNRISALIDRYGKSFDNLSKGKNLFTKLLLENRIKIIEITI